MKSFNYYSPTKFIFGKKREEEVGKCIKELGGGNVLIVFSPFAKRSGLIDRVEKSLVNESIDFVEFGKVKENPTSTMVYEGIDLCKEKNVDFILAVGGGSAMDTAKAIAMGVKYHGDFWDFFSGKNPTDALPIGVIATISASGSEGSPNAIITNVKTLDKNAAESDLIRPKFAIMNPELTMTLNPYQTACGITDIFSHCLERYFSNTEDIKLTDRMLEGLMKSLVDDGLSLIENPDDYGARANIMWAATLAHNDILGVGRDQDWNTHHLEHVLSAKYNCVHGAGIAVMFPAWMRFVVERHGVMKFAQFANRVFGFEMDFENPKTTALRGITAFEDFLIALKMPINFKELGIRADEIDSLVEMNHLGNGKTAGFYNLDNNDIKEIYLIAAKNRL
ncbi:MAG: iron-containing alcohol dehydrogenase [Bacillota bacterium]|nr:iron-containing alcohol dehydrogenase [Bacillota bacterium]